jgi:hypothetical protein
LDVPCDITTGFGQIDGQAFDRAWSAYEQKATYAVGYDLLRLAALACWLTERRLEP